MAGGFFSGLIGGQRPSPAPAQGLTPLQQALFALGGGLAQASQQGMRFGPGVASALAPAAGAYQGAVDDKRKKAREKIAEEIAKAELKQKQAEASRQEAIGGLLGDQQDFMAQPAGQLGGNPQYAALRAKLAAMPPDQRQGLSLLSPSEREAALRDLLLPKQSEPYTLSPGGRRFGPNNELLAQAPHKPADGYSLSATERNRQMKIEQIVPQLRQQGMSEIEARNRAAGIVDGTIITVTDPYNVERTRQFDKISGKFLNQSDAPSPQAASPQAGGKEPTIMDDLRTQQNAEAGVGIAGGVMRGIGATVGQAMPGWADREAQQAYTRRKIGIEAVKKALLSGPTGIRNTNKTIEELDKIMGSDWLNSAANAEATFGEMAPYLQQIHDDNTAALQDSRARFTAADRSKMQNQNLYIERALKRIGPLTPVSDPEIDALLDKYAPVKVE